MAILVFFEPSRMSALNDSLTAQKPKVSKNASPAIHPLYSDEV
jgi:hypothetical protein